jgi:hypothetical protein
MPGGSFWEKWTVLAKREEKERKITILLQMIRYY